ncbi:MAG: hypothetical protein DME86_03120 [Verrucomicrobia bacterium]|nr:MAG: hypothetical protein DME86_03120 [Verrucomicrobiota bacterium]
MGDLLGVALIHLATVGLDKKLRHGIANDTQHAPSRYDQRSGQRGGSSGNEFPRACGHVRRGESVLWRIERMCQSGSDRDISQYFWLREIVRDSSTPLGMTKALGMRKAAGFRPNEETVSTCFETKLRHFAFHSCSAFVSIVLL